MTSFCENMNKLLQLLSAWFCLAAVALCLSGCRLSSYTTDKERSVVWNWSTAYTNRVESMTIKPDEAQRIAGTRTGEGHIGRGKPSLMVGNWYRFAQPTKSHPYLSGYYVH